VELGERMSGPAVVVTSRSFSSGDVDARARLAAAGVQLTTGPADHELWALRPLLATAVAWIAGAGPITSAHLDAAPQLRLIARYGVGVDAVDVAEATRRDIWVTNTPGANSGAVADHALALMLAALRKVTRGDRNVRRGDWGVDRSRELGNLCVGIVGVGRIGRGVAARLDGFGSTLLGHDPWIADDGLRSAGIQPVSMLELAERGDIVSLHAPGDQTIIGQEWLATAKPGLILVNTARANLVDEAAVAAALSAHQMSMYAADTLSSQSSLTGPGDQNPLLSPELADRTIFTPHTAAHTVEAVDKMSIGTVNAVLALLRGHTPPNPVNALPSKQTR
jgi:D-3-phosphoglycerate dehydrogenase / 2-oxoglutarate reductase